MPPRTAYYPGSEGRVAAFCKSFPDAEEFGGGDGVSPWRFKTGLSPEQVYCHCICALQIR